MRVQPPFAPRRQERPCRETSSATGWRLTSGLFVGYLRSTTNPWGILLGIFGGSVPPGSSNPDPMYDEKMSSSTPVFRPDLKNPCPFSDLAFRQKFSLRSKRFQSSYSRKLLRAETKKRLKGDGDVPLPLPRHSFFFLLLSQLSRRTSRGNACYAG